MDPIKAYFSKVPAVVCAAGSYIVFMNTNAAESPWHMSVGEELYSMMSPKDTLKFESLFEGYSNGGCLSFPLQTSRRSGIAFAVFGGIMGRRYATVMLFESELCLSEHIKCLEKDTSPLSREEMVGFVQRFVGVSDRFLIEEDCRRMTDLVGAGRHTVSTVGALAGFSEISFTAIGRDGGPFSSFCDISTSGYTRILSAMLFAADVVSSDRRIRAVLLGEGREVRLCVTTGLSEKDIDECSRGDISGMIAPAAGYIELCGHVAGAERGEFSYDLSYHEREMSFVLSLGTAENDTVEFKSPADPRILLDSLSFTVEHLLRMRSGNA